MPISGQQQSNTPFSPQSSHNPTPEEQYQIKSDEDGKSYILTKQIAGRMVVTNFDPENLSNEERIQLNQKARLWPRTTSRSISARVFRVMNSAVSTWVFGGWSSGTALSSLIIE